MARKTRLLAAKKKMVKKKPAKPRVPSRFVVDLPRILEIGLDAYFESGNPCLATLQMVLPGVESIQEVGHYECPDQGDPYGYDDGPNLPKCTCRTFYLLTNNPANKRTGKEKKLVADLKEAIKEQRERDKVFEEDY